MSGPGWARAVIQRSSSIADHAPIDARTAQGDAAAHSNPHPPSLEPERRPALDPRRAHVSKFRPTVAGAGAVILFVALVVASAAALRSEHATARRDLESAFAERAKVSAALTRSLFESTTASARATDAKLYGGKRVSQAAVDAGAAAGKSTDLLVLAADGHIIAASANTPAPVRQAMASRPPVVRDALAGRAFALSDVMALGPRNAVVQFALPFDTPSGKRVLVSGFPPQLLSGFFAGYLAGAATSKSSQAFMIDGKGSILAGAGMPAPHGALDARLLRATLRGTHGTFAPDRYFAASRVQNSDWRVVVTTAQSALFASVEGASTWVPRILFFAFVLAVALALFLTMRVRRKTAAQREADARLRATAEERLQLASFVESSTDAIIGKSLDATITSWNAAAEKLYGYSAAEVIGRRIELLFPPGYAEEGEAIMCSIRAGESTQLETKRVACDGRVIDVALTVSPVHRSDGSLTGACEIARDITDRKRAEAELVLAHERALEASRSKSEFVANMSHEIRTPLNGVIGMSDLLRETDLDEVQHEYVDALAASGEALLAVISDVLDFSKIEAGRLELDPIAFDLRESVEQACEMLAGQAHAKGFQLSHWVDADVPATVHGDSARLRQILLNLLSNAVKFTAEGEIVLRVRRHSDEVLHFAVADTGVGIDSAKASRLFEAFRQADQSTTRQYGGTGLGLAISSRLVGLLGGDIGVEPNAGKGSVFWFTARLPAVSDVAGPDREHANLDGLRALIVDDNATNRTIFEHYLRAWGLACESGPDASSALDALERSRRDARPFEVALLDYQLPDRSGLELARQIRERPALHALKLVVLTSMALERRPFDDLDIAAILAKPPRQSALYNAITTAVAGASARDEADPHTKTIATPRGPLVLVAEDNEINRTLAQALLGKHGLRTAIAHNGREAVDMALTNEYSAILMDCQMPEIDGYQATQLIRQAERGRRVPIIAMTAHSMSGDRERCLAAGMDDYLSKPIRTEELEGIIERWLSGDGPPDPGNGDGDGDGVVGQGEDERRERELLDEASIELLASTLAPEVRTRLLDTFEKQLSKCVGGIVVAIQTGDHAERRRLAHLLKGSCATIGARRLQSLCAALEHTGRAGDPEITLAQVQELQAAVDDTSEALGRRLR